MIATLAEIKAILGITGTGSDTQITALMPIVQADILDYCNNDFSSCKLTYTASDITFTLSTLKIESLTGGITADSFMEGSTDIVVYNSLFNDYHYTVATIADTYFTVDESITDEDSERSITIKTVFYPTALKSIFASMITTKINVNNTGGIKSKKLETFSVTYSTEDMSGGYLKTDLQSLTKYRKMV